jgi:hypothetical protein
MASMINDTTRSARSAGRAPLSPKTSALTASNGNITINNIITCQCLFPGRELLAQRNG